MAELFKKSLIVCFVSTCVYEALGYYARLNFKVLEDDIMHSFILGSRGA